MGNVPHPPQMVLCDSIPMTACGIEELFMPWKLRKLEPIIGVSPNLVRIAPIVIRLGVGCQVHRSHFRLARKVLVHAREAIPDVNGVVLRIPDAFTNGQGEHTLNAVTVTFEHFSFAALIIPAHHPNSPFHLRNVIWSVEPRISRLIGNLVPRCFPVELIPTEIGWSP